MVTGYPPGKPVHDKGQIIELPVELIIGYVADPYLLNPRQYLAGSQVFKAFYPGTVRGPAHVDRPLGGEAKVFAEPLEGIPAHVRGIYHVIHVPAVHGGVVFPYFIDQKQQLVLPVSPSGHPVEPLVEGLFADPDTPEQPVQAPGVLFPVLPEVTGGEEENFFLISTP